MVIGILGIIDWVMGIFHKPKPYVDNKPLEPCEKENSCEGCTAYPEGTKYTDDISIPCRETVNKPLLDAMDRARYLMGIDRPLRKDEERIIVLYTERIKQADREFDRFIETFKGCI